MEELHGQIENITYASEETGFTIARVRQESDGGVVTVVGNLMAPPAGTSLHMKGEWVRHAKYGRQFKVAGFYTTLPATERGIRNYLGSGMISGLGQTMAARIVDAFGKDTLSIIEENPEMLRQVEGIGKKRVSMIKQAWDDQKEIRGVMIFLQSHGVSIGYAVKIFKQYGNDSIKVVSENPYCLATDITGIGFKIADSIAEKVGFAKDSDFRASAGVLYALDMLSTEGHVYYPCDELMVRCSEFLGVDGSIVKKAVDNLCRDRRIIISRTGDGDSQDGVYLAPLFFCEKGVADRIDGLVNTPPAFPPLDSEKEVTWLQNRLTIELAPNQVAAVKNSLTSKVMVITGGPGTGKTTIINSVLKIFSRHERTILLAAPTGRAAKRMSETTGHPAKTIHRLLEFSFSAGGFQKNDKSPLKCDVLVVDEASMIDITLMYQLLKAVPPTAVLILVGDVDQLPSVGAGNVLNDIIDSGAVGVVRLKEIFRQADESRIIVNAHKINMGIVPVTNKPSPGDDFYFIEQQNPERVVELILELVKERIPRRFNFDPFNDIQVLTPMHKGIVGGENLNQCLQASLNNGAGGVVRGDRTFRPGDKVMQIRNNYDKDVFNGDIGRIISIDQAESELLVSYDGKTVVYESSDLDEITLAYAISVHKSQGSEYPAIVMPVCEQHYIMLQRNLIYTGITRGQDLVVLVGTRKALAMAVHNNKTRKRFTDLKYRMR